MVYLTCIHCARGYNKSFMNTEDYCSMICYTQDKLVDFMKDRIADF